jgi:hypothetical protein
MEWQDIATVPKDGTPFWFKKAGKEYLGFWIGHKDGHSEYPWGFIDPNTDDGVNAFRAEYGPESWMPVSPPNKQKVN